MCRTKDEPGWEQTVEKSDLTQLLRDVRDGNVRPEDAEARIAAAPYVDLG